MRTTKQQFEDNRILLTQEEDFDVMVYNRLLEATWEEQEYLNNNN